MRAAQKDEQSCQEVSRCRSIGQGALMKAETLQYDASRFAKLTFPRFVPLLADIRPPYLACGLCGSEGPVGLALSMIQDGHARLLSLYVVPHARGAGCGTRLLNELEEKHRGSAELIWAEYTSSLPQRCAFERTLRRAGWDPPVVREVRASGAIGPLIAIMRTWPGMDEEQDRRRGVVFEPWLPTAADENAFGELANEAGFLPELAPARYHDRIDALISLAIRREQQLVGWVLGERLPDPPGLGVRLNCASAYVTQSLWHTGVLIRAYFRTLLLAREAYGAETDVSLYAALPRLRALVARRTNSIATFVDILQAMKKLT